MARLGVGELRAQRLGVGLGLLAPLVRRLRVRARGGAARGLGLVQRRRARLLEPRMAHLVQRLGPLALDGPVEVHQEQARLGRREPEGGRGRSGVRWGGR